MNNQRLQALTSQAGYDIESINPKKIRALGQATAYDVCASTASNRVSNSSSIGVVLKSGICHAFTPDGRCVSLFKTLYTNACTHACKYCPNATTCKKAKAIYKYVPEELAKITIELYKSNYIEGLFLSSGVAKNEEYTMQEMLDSVRILRQKYKFGGYIHLKILPGAQKEHIKQAVELADRVSINIEAPSKSRMSEMSDTKDYKNDILQRQKYIRDEVKKACFGAGHTTQMIIGSVQEPDKEIFSSMIYEYTNMNTKRVYYSAFNPVCATLFEKNPAQALWRENRLYQMDWLYRVYGFRPKILKNAFNDDGNLANKDPKIEIAKYFLDSPIDPQNATKDELLSIPGIGIKSAQRILEARKYQVLDTRQKIANLGVVLKRALPYLKINGFFQTSIVKWS